MGNGQCCIQQDKTPVATDVRSCGCAWNRMCSIKGLQNSCSSFNTCCENPEVWFAPSSLPLEKINPLEVPGLEEALGAAAVRIEKLQAALREAEDKRAEARAFPACPVTG